MPFQLSINDLLPQYTLKCSISMYVCSWPERFNSKWATCQPTQPPALPRPPTESMSFPSTPISLVHKPQVSPTLKHVSHPASSPLYTTNPHQVSSSPTSYPSMLSPATDYLLNTKPKDFAFLILLKKLSNRGLPWWSNGKESAFQCRGCGFDPWSGN